MAKKRISKKIIKLVRNYIERLEKKEELPITQVIIFGSRAKGKNRRLSDIDVCVISPRFKDSLKALEFLWQKRKDEEVRAGLEPVGFSEKDFREGNSLIEEIKKSGIRISK
jgi:predicted nucleotidyltransferase